MNNPSIIARQWKSALTATALICALAASPAFAADKLRVGKSVTSSYFFSLMELGKEQGHYTAQNIDVEISAFAGDARMQQALTANAIDIGLGSGPGMGFAAKGVPGIAVAAIADRPLNMALSVDPKIKSIEELKGRTVAVTTAGSLTDWLARKMSDSKGWGPGGIKVLAMGDTRTRIAALKRGDIQGFVTATEVALNLQEEGVATMLTTFGDAVVDFHTHVIFAHRNLIAKNPDLLRRYLRGWFTTARFARDNKAATVASVAKTMKLPEKIVAMAYDAQISMTNYDGTFSEKALETIRHSLKELNILDRVPEVKEILLPGFVPVKL
ncbi:MAG: ABC transporter substrate-binding protein [Alphaproteobacteria bacterium]|nr:ABC transporter substrate-binding protein [Alphaproteobacteria bacterium]